MIDTKTAVPALTHRQNQVYQFLKDKIQNRGYGPTVREMIGAFDIKSPNGITCHLKALEKKGYITGSLGNPRDPIDGEATHGVPATGGWDDCRRPASSRNRVTGTCRICLGVR